MNTGMEAVRKLIHISGVLTIVLAELLGRTFLSSVVLVITAVFMISEYLRLQGKALPVVTEITRMAAREDEAADWVLRPVFYAVGIIIAMNLFPRPVNYAAIAILTVGDGFASFVGTRFGRHRFPYNHDKTLEGSISFFLASFFSTLIFVSPPAALLGSMVGAFTESLPTGSSENVVVPAAAGLCMSILPLFM